MLYKIYTLDTNGRWYTGVDVASEEVHIVCYLNELIHVGGDGDENVYKTQAYTVLDMQAVTVDSTQAVTVDNTQADTVLDTWRNFNYSYNFRFFRHFGAKIPSFRFFLC